MPEHCEFCGAEVSPLKAGAAQKITAFSGQPAKMHVYCGTCWYRRCRECPACLFVRDTIQFKWGKPEDVYASNPCMGALIKT